MANFFLSRAAQKHLQDIAQYTQQNWGAAQVKKYLQEIEMTMNFLLEQPHLGRLCPELGEQIFRFPVKSHMIYYRVRKQDIVIIGVLHKSMLPHYI